MYTSLRELWHGFTKNMYLGADGDLRKLGAGALVLALLSVAPAAFAIDAPRASAALRALEALLCLANGIAVEAQGLRKTGIPRAFAWYAPFGYAVVRSDPGELDAAHADGRGVEWRGRRYTGRAGGNGP